MSESDNRTEQSEVECEVGGKTYLVGFYGDRPTSVCVLVPTRGWRSHKRALWFSHDNKPMTATVERAVREAILNGGAARV